MSCLGHIREGFTHTFWKCSKCGTLNSLIEKNFCVKCNKEFDCLDDKMIYLE